MSNSASGCSSDGHSMWIEVLEQFYALFYAIPSSILYVLVVMSVSRASHHYSLVFVRLFSLICIFNLLTYWFEFFFNQVLGFWPFCPTFTTVFANTYYLSFPAFLDELFPLAGFLTCIALSIYQLSAVVAPTSYEQMWRRHLNTVTALIIIIPAILCSHILISTGKIIPLSTKKVYIRSTHFFPFMDVVKSSLISAVMGMFSFAIISSTTLFALFRIIQIKRKNNRSVHGRVFLTSAWICISQAIYIVFQVFMYYARSSRDEYAIIAMLYEYRTLIYDICYLLIPWVVIIVNRRIRQSVFNVFTNTTISSFGPKQLTLVH